jgi:hypothetical protein
MGHILEDLVERQHISRLDTIAFLSYPALIAGWTAFANVIWNYQVLRSTKIFDLEVVWFLIPIMGAIVILMLSGFLNFGRAYLADDLKGRVHAWHSFSENLSRMIVFTLIFPIYLIAYDLYQKYPLDLLLRPIVIAWLLMSVMLALFAAWEEFVSRPLGKFLESWLGSNAPRKLEASGIDFQKEFLFRVPFSKICMLGWVSFCISYTVVTALVLMADGIRSTGFYHLDVLATAITLAGIAWYYLRRPRHSS